MSKILGIELYEGAEVPPPAPIDKTLPSLERCARESDWMNRLIESLQDNDPWGFMAIRSDGTKTVYDTSAASMLRLVQREHTCYLILGK